MQQNSFCAAASSPAPPHTPNRVLARKGAAQLSPTGPIGKGSIQNGLRLATFQHVARTCSHVEVALPGRKLLKARLDVAVPVSYSRPSTKSSPKTLRTDLHALHSISTRRVREEACQRRAGKACEA